MIQTSYIFETQNLRKIFKYKSHYGKYILIISMFEKYNTNTHTKSPYNLSIKSNSSGNAHLLAVYLTKVRI
jgi:hypothetical protein